jgi:hypothetical protein
MGNNLKGVFIAYLKVPYQCSVTLMKKLENFSHYNPLI